MQNKFSKITDAVFEQILSAINAPFDGEALMHVLAPIGRVARTWSAPTKRAGEWSGKIVELVALMAHECRDPEVKKIYYGSPKLDSSSTYKNIFEISSCGALAWDREALDELLLYCVCICSGNGFALSDGISAGLLNCYRVRPEQLPHAAVSAT